MTSEVTAAAFRVWLDGGILGAAGAGNVPAVEGAPGITGGLGIAFGQDPHRNVGLLLQEREFVTGLVDRHVSSIGVLLRYPAADGPYALVGGVHNHELPWSTWLEDPGGSIAATRLDITHRTGVEFGGGWDFSPMAPDSPVASLFRPTLQLSVGVLPGTDGALAYGMLRFSMRLGIMKVGGPV